MPLIDSWLEIAEPSWQGSATALIDGVDCGSQRGLEGVDKSESIKLIAIAIEVKEDVSGV